jgi:hypothetical protein
VRAIHSDLSPAQETSDVGALSEMTFICHRCERVFRSAANELVYAVDIDATYHEHDDALFRAFVMLQDGTVQIGAFGSAEEDVIQRYRLDRPGGSDHGESLRECSRRFFDSMRAQNRRVEPAELRIDIL